MKKEDIIKEIQEFDSETEFDVKATHDELKVELKRLKVEAVTAEIWELDPNAQTLGLGLSQLNAKLSEVKADLEAKEELTSKILELDPGARLDDLSLEELTAELAGLKPDPEAGARDAADAKKTAQKKKAEDVEKIKVKKPPYYVAPGKAITTKRGILGGKPEDEIGPETEIKKRDFSDGGTSFEKWVKLGYIIKG